MDLEHILEFCGDCGILLPEGMGNWPQDEQLCANCGNKVYQSEQRIHGIFTEEDAIALRTAQGQL